VIAKLFLGNLPYTVTEDEIEGLLAEAGFARNNAEEIPEGLIAKIVSIRVVRDRDTGLSRGFGFVEMEDKDSATQARDNLLQNRAALNNRELVVDLAKPAGAGRGLRK